MPDVYLSSETIWLLLPEMILLGLAVWTYLLGAVVGGRGGFVALAVCGVAAAGWVLYLQDQSWGILDADALRYASGPLIVDYFGHAARWVAWLVGLLFVLITARAGSDRLATELLGSVLLVVAGMMIVCTAGDLVLLFLGLELISIPTYVLLYLGRRDAASQEATVKYFFLSILASNLLLYGFSFLYGATGSLDLDSIRSVLESTRPGQSGLVSLVPLAMVLIVAGLAFKMTFVPFHFYAPDVYQGTTNGNAGILAIAPKLAGLLVLIRLLVVMMPAIDPIAWQVLVLLSIATMILGNTVALLQNNIRRMMAYSSIAHAGYMLIGIAVAAAAGDAQVGPFGGLSAALFYLFVYTLATLGVFAALAYLSRRSREVNSVDELSGLGRSHPLMALGMAACLFSLTGIPPLAGFWGKLGLFADALTFGVPSETHGWNPWFVTLAVVGAINAAISAGYYLRLVAVMYFRPPGAKLDAEGGPGAGLALVATALLVLVVGLAPGRWMTAAARAGRAAVTHSLDTRTASSPWRQSQAAPRTRRR